MKIEESSGNVFKDIGLRVIDEIAAERRRQVEVEGWTPEHDDTHKFGEMADAAACYCLGPTFLARHRHDAVNHFWPWDRAWWKPTNRRRNLIKAAALIVAEIERLDRATPQTGESRE